MPILAIIVAVVLGGSLAVNSVSHGEPDHTTNLDSETSVRGETYATTSSSHSKSPMLIPYVRTHADLGLTGSASATHNPSDDADDDAERADSRASLSGSSNTVLDLDI